MIKSLKVVWSKFAAQRTTHRLALSYLAVIMVMSLGFSAVFYHTTSHELGRQLPPSSLYDRSYPDYDDRFDSFFNQRIEEGRQVLLTRLLFINLGALLVGAILSYLLARYTLRPIEANMTAQARFIGDASHELRTPLTAIKTANEVALRSPTLKLAQAKALLGDNLAAVNDLQVLTDNLLSLARQDEALIKLQPVSSQAAISQAVNRVLPLAQARQLTIDDNVADFQVMADPTSLVQLLVIILDNAIKYSPATSVISLQGSVQGYWGRFSIADRGVGIAPGDIDHIFDRFYRADQSRNKQVAGFGLGLSLAQALIESMHGHIDVESTSEQGSVFRCNIPLA